MQSIADIILKHDGYIWGEYVWSKFSFAPEDIKKIKCRFVSKNLFGFSESLVIPKHFMIDLNHHFKIKTIRKNLITLENGIDIEVFIHNASEELDFMRNADFTCNLLDYRRDGLLVRNSTSSIEYEVSPYETVISHIQEKILDVVNMSEALKTAEYMVEHGWSSDIFQKVDLTEQCSICHEILGNNELCVKQSCSHIHHVNCLKKWMADHTTCPMCRSQL